MINSTALWENLDPSILELFTLADDHRWLPCEEPDSRDQPGYERATYHEFPKSIRERG